jgi:membrane protein
MGVGAAVKEVSERTSSIVRLELELAALELKQKAANLGFGLGLVAGAALVGLYAVGFLFATIAAALAIVLDTWLALLIVFLGLLIVTGLLVLLGVKKLQKGTPPVPKQAIEEAKLTKDAMRGGTHAG